ncbi:MAG: hypothetical protein IKA24_06235 [Mogibacterium sp.]|nr:hypothetical protein [Mogibacterium sp.]
MNLGDYITALKPYCKRRRMSNEEFVNHLLEPLVDSYSVKDRNGNIFALDRYRVSRIIRHSEDVPEALRKPLDMVGVEERILEGFQYFYDIYIDGSRGSEIVTDFTRRITLALDLSEEEKAYILSDDPVILLERLFLSSLKFDNEIESADSTLWRRGRSYIKIVYGDIFKFGFDKRNKSNRIVVIPVNTSFETRISDNMETSCSPLVSAESLHGGFLQRLYLKQMSPDDISSRISANLYTNNLAETCDIAHNLPIGTIASLQFGKCIFYLLAVSTFDADNVAHSSRDDIAIAIDKLAEYYDKKGLGYDMYVPLMGTGLSRAYLSNQDSFDIICGSLLRNKEKLQGKINIVILPEISSTINTGGFEQ